MNLYLSYGVGINTCRYLETETWGKSRALLKRADKHWFTHVNPIIPYKFYELAANFIHLVICLTTDQKPLPKRALHIVRSRASSLKWEYPPLSLRSSISFLRLLLHLPVNTIPPFIFLSITCSRRQILRKMWPTQLAFRLLISCRMLRCSLTLSNTSSFLTWLVQLILSILLQYHISKFSTYFKSTARNVQVSAPYKAML